MHDIEPFFNWRHLYLAEEDEVSPFFGRTHSEFAFTQTIYNYFIHPQWDDFGSPTLYVKVLYADYPFGYAIIEMIGEWNDAIENDVMTLKREVIDPMIIQGITKFILITENVLNFHHSDDCYYEEWWEDIQDQGGWVASLNMPQQTESEFQRNGLDRFIHLFEVPNWRNFLPQHLFSLVDNRMMKRLN